MNVIKSELYKLKHTWVPWIHILLPIIYALLFWGAAKVTTLKNFSIAEIYQSYASILGGLLPTIIGLLTAQMIDMEFEAGRFQVLLAETKRRSQSYLGKLSVLLLGGFVAITMSIGIYTVIWKPNLGRWSCRNFFPLYRNHFGISHSLMVVPCNKWECFYWSWIY